MSVLAIDLGTSAVKAIVWNASDGVLARGSAPIDTVSRQPGWAEQDSSAWWAAVMSALTGLPRDDITTIGLSSQRETFVCLDENCQPLRDAILWSDGRGATPGGRVAWLREHEPDVISRTRYLAAPKDYVLHRLTGHLVTDATLASRTDVDRALLPDVVDPRAIVGEHGGVPVVAGAGDRACEAFAVGASAIAPMVSWGTTANVSMPVRDVDVVPAGWVASQDVSGATLLEAGVSAAGSALGWLAMLTRLSTDELTGLAAAAPPGANGVTALPWFNGARAPWWRPDADAAFLGITTATDAGDMARAIYEGVAHDIRRALCTVPQRPTELRLAGGGADDPVWREVLSGITGVGTAQSHGPDAAAIGAALLASGDGCEAAGEPATVVRPSDDLVATYAALSKDHDAKAASVLGSLP